ncbi:metallophosphoesterase family protein [bacterium]|nr:metallophosphoesterase family protein [bacterium]
MKIAVISDLHANPKALLEVLEDIKAFSPDKIFCLGDLILAGYDPNKVCEIIFNLKDKYKENFEIIQGNTDKMVANCDDALLQKTKEAFPCMGYSLEEDVKITDKKYIDFVKNLPENKKVEVNGLKIHLVHGSIRNQSENIFPNLDLKVVEEMVKDTDCEVILCGHTHIPCGYSLESGKTVVNVGSVGRSMTEDKMPVYLQMTIDKNGQFFVEPRIIPYDNKFVYDKIIERNFKDCQSLANMYIKKGK